MSGAQVASNVQATTSTRDYVVRDERIVETSGLTAQVAARLLEHDETGEPAQHRGPRRDRVLGAARSDARSTADEAGLHDR